MTTTDKLLNLLNQVRGLKSNQIGYSYFADIKGDGQKIKAIWSICNENGGVIYSHLNDASSRKRCEKIRKEIQKEFLS